MSDVTQGASQQFLTFLVGDEEYAVDILKVQEIRGWSPVTAIPNTPDYICGVLNLRGSIVPVVDMRVRFSIGEATYLPTTVIVLVNVTEQDTTRTVGLVADAVSDVYDISVKDAQIPPNLGGTIDTEFVKALVTIGDNLIVVLNIDELVNTGVLNGPGFDDQGNSAGLSEKQPPKNENVEVGVERVD